MPEKIPETAPNVIATYRCDTCDFRYHDHGSASQFGFHRRIMARYGVRTWTEAQRLLDARMLDCGAPTPGGLDDGFNASWVGQECGDVSASSLRIPCPGRLALVQDLSARLAAMRTSDLLAAMIEDRTGPRCRGDNRSDWPLLAAELDRRIPPPDRRIGKRCRLRAGSTLLWQAGVGRIVDVELDGTLRYRDDNWSPALCDIRIAATDIAEWLVGHHGDHDPTTIR